MGPFTAVPLRSVGSVLVYARSESKLWAILGYFYS